jgi:hypothetical protein
VFGKARERRLSGDHHRLAALPPPPFAFDTAAYARSGYAQAPVVSVEEAGYLRGHRLAQITIHPVDYDPAAGRLRILEVGRIRVTLTGTDRAATEAKLARYASDPFERAVARLALNGDGTRYNPGHEIVYLVISAPTFFANADLLRLLDWKTQRGFHVTHVSTDETGTTKEQIKAYIQNAYDNWTIPPTFVLLVGDTDRIPHWVGIGADSPTTDLNYTMLAGSDYFPDLGIGRLGVVDATDLANVVNKTLNFERIEWSGNDDWEKHATFMASTDNYPVSEGTHNFVITTYLDSLGYTSDRLYSHNGATTQQVRDAFNAGRSQGTYSGHGAETYWADGPVFYQSDVNGLTNTVYPLVQSYACLTGNFAVAECFGETWIRATHGAVAFFGSSVTSYWTEDDILEKRVYQGCYDDQNPGEVDQTWLAGMFIYGKMKFYEYFGNTSTVRRYFEMYNVLGDPSVDLWTAVPVASQVTAPPTLLAGQTSFEVTVTATPNAMVSARKLTDGNTIFVTGWADASGHATLSLGQALLPGTLHLAVTHHDRIPYFADIQVIQPSGPYLVMQQVSVMDPQGDGDQQADAGESIGLALTLGNIGVDAATGVSGTLSSADPLVQITAPVRSYPDIPAGANRTNADPFMMDVSANAPDQHTVALNLDARSAQGQWDCPFNLVVQAPVLGPGGNLVDDSQGGNSDGGADPGESIELMFWINNTGHGDARNLSGILTCSDPSIIISDDQADCLVVPVGEQGLLSSFHVEIPPECPTPSNLALHVALSGPGGYQAALDYELPVGAWVDDVESDRGWTCGVPGDNATTGLWVRAEPVGTTYNGQQCQPEYDHTPDPGEICFVTGNGTPGGAAGENDVDGGKTTLLSPVFNLAGGTSATFSYWRWYTDNLGNNPNEDYWTVDVTSDGTNWVHLEHTTDSSNAWEQHTFQLEQYVPLTGHVQVRFIADDEINNSLLEAAVDDISLNAVISPPTGVAPQAASLQCGLIGSRPNPLRAHSDIVFRLAAAQRARIELFDLGGRKLRTVLDQFLPAGEHAVRFDGLSGTGTPLASGIYFLRMETPGLRQVKQVTVLR